MFGVFLKLVLWCPKNYRPAGEKTNTKYGPTLCGAEMAPICFSQLYQQSSQYCLNYPQKKDSKFPKRIPSWELTYPTMGKGKIIRTQLPFFIGYVIVPWRVVKSSQPLHCERPKVEVRKVRRWGAVGKAWSWELCLYEGKGHGWVQKLEAGQFLRCVISDFVWKADVFFLWIDGVKCGWNPGFLLGCLIEKSIWFHFIKCVSMQSSAYTFATQTCATFLCDLPTVFMESGVFYLIYQSRTFEPRKNPLTFHYTGCLRVVLIRLVYYKYYNPHFN